MNPVLESLRVRALNIPFKQAFAHASAIRASTQALWVEVTDSNGLVGYGEGCPREYVTGETLSGAIEFVGALESEVLDRLGDLESLKTWTGAKRALIDANPAAFCALELALLDLFAKQAGVSVEGLLELPSLAGEFQYSAVIGDSDAQRFEAELTRYRQVGFSQFKIKLSGDSARDAGKIAALRAAGIAPEQVRADANNLWDNTKQAGDALELLDYPFFALEEPLSAGDIDGMAQLANRLGCAIILDESATRIEQLERLCGNRRWIINLRVSKMGGLLRSLEFANRAGDTGVDIIVGAQVGETSLLTRAALTVANATRPSLVAQEGAFGTHLLAYDIVDTPLMFGAGGKLLADSVPQGTGFGIKPTRI